MVYAHGSTDDWNRYASVTGDAGWNWANIQKYIAKVRFYYFLLNLILTLSVE